MISLQGKCGIIEPMSLREKANEIFDWGVKQCHDDVVDAWVAHSRGTAEICEKVAAKCGLDAEKAYACGLLHDIGHYKGMETGLNHIIDGYEFLMQKDLPEIARVCLTHTFNPKDKVDHVKLDDPDKVIFLKNYIKNTEYDDYDLLTQLADYMAGAHGITTIERRFCSVLWRHGLKNPQKDLIALYKLKDYFSEKVGKDIYELFRDEVMRSTLNGTPGLYIKDSDVQEE